jgi:hypothetical protein
MKRALVLVMAMTVFVTVHTSRSEALPIPDATYQVSMTYNGTGVTPVDLGNRQYESINGNAILLVGFSSGNVQSALAQGWSGGTNDKGTASGIEDYYFSVKPLIPNYIFPLGLTVTFTVTYYGEVKNQMTGPWIGDELGSSTAVLTLNPPENGPPNQLFSLNVQGFDKFDSKTGKYVGSTTPGDIWGLNMDSHVGWTSMGSVLSFKALVDPTLEIDPDCYVTIEGQLIQANTLFGVEVSPNIVPIPGAWWLFGSGLLGLAGWRRFMKN